MINKLNKQLHFDKTLIWGALAIMLAALLWSLDGTFIRPKFYTLPAPLVVFLEHALGFIVLSPFIILSWSKIKLLRQRDWGAILWICFFGGLIGTITITQAFFAAVAGQVTFATVVILQKLQPVFALLLARLILGEKLTRQFYAWAVVAIIAAYFLSFGKNGLALNQLNLWHNAAFFAIIAAFAFGSSTVFGKRVVNHLDFKSTTALRFGITSVMALIWILLTREIFSVVQVAAWQWWFLVLIVFSSGAVAMFIYYFGLKRTSASAATICELFWPFSAVILDYFINKNILNTVQIISALILLIAFFMIMKVGRAKNMEFEAEIITGAGRGLRLGFPTINLNKIDLNMAYGIYLVEARIDNQAYQGLLHFGLKDTFAEGTSQELYIKQTIARIIDNKIKIKIIKKIREVMKFADTEKLKKQIEEDIKFLA